MPPSLLKGPSAEDYLVAEQLFEDRKTRLALATREQRQAWLLSIEQQDHNVGSCLAEILVRKEFL